MAARERRHTGRSSVRREREGVCRRGLFVGALARIECHYNTSLSPCWLRVNKPRLSPRFAGTRALRFRHRAINRRPFIVGARARAILRVGAIKGIRRLRAYTYIIRRALLQVIARSCKFRGPFVTLSAPIGYSHRLVEHSFVSTSLSSSRAASMRGHEALVFRN